MYSLTARLLLSTLGIIITMYAITGYVLYLNHRNTLLKNQELTLQSEAFALIPFIAQDGANISLIDTPSQPRLSQPGSGLFATVTHPVKQTVWASQSSTGDAPALSHFLAPGVYRFEQLPDHTFLFSFGLPAGLTLNVLETPDGFDLRLGQYRNLITGWLSILGVVTLLIILAAAKWSLRPLQRAREEIHQIQAGEQTFMSEHFPTEVLPLTASINALVESSQQQINTHRNALTELAHRLKTPLAVMQSEIDTHSVLKRELVHQQIELLDNSIKYYLNRAATRGPQTGAHCEIIKATQRMLQMFRKVYPEKQFSLTTALPGSTNWTMDEQDFMELCGNLIDNAGKWSKSSVIVEIDILTNNLLITISDDGPGINAYHWSELLKHGVHGDSDKSETGVGLAASYEIARQYQGELSMKVIESGGTRILIKIPKLSF